MTSTTYHIVSAEYFRDYPTTEPYQPPDFAAEGFIHCTTGEHEVAETANRHFKHDRRMYIALVIDTSRVEADIRYEGQSGIYPHIYGRLNRDAITAVRPLLREADGTFLPPRP